MVPYIASLLEYSTLKGNLTLIRKAGDMVDVGTHELGASETGTLRCALVGCLVFLCLAYKGASVATGERLLEKFHPHTEGDLVLEISKLIFPREIQKCEHLECCVLDS